MIDLVAIRTYCRENLEHPDLVVEHGSPRLFWSAVMDRAEREGRVTIVVDEVLRDNPGAARLREVLSAWQQSHEPSNDSSPRPAPVWRPRWPQLAVLCVSLLVVGGIVWVRRPTPVSVEAPSQDVAPVGSAPAAVGAGAAPEVLLGQASHTAPVFTVATPNATNARPRDAAAPLVHVGSGEFEPGTPDARSALAACTEVEGDAQACKAWLKREVGGVRRVVSAFEIDRTEVPTEAFAEWVGRGIDSGRFEVDAGAVVFASQALWRATAGFSGLTVTQGATAPRVTFARDVAALPITGVTHVGAREYCATRAARLPTALEWEFAARGSRGRSFVWEVTPSCEQVAYGRLPSGRQTAAPCAGFAERPNPVGASAADESWSGARDLGANVSEWVADGFVDAGDSKCGPRGSVASPCYVIKGGSFADPLFVARPASITRAPFDAAFAHVGFRCARTSPGAR